MPVAAPCLELWGQSQTAVGPGRFLLPLPVSKLKGSWSGRDDATDHTQEPEDDENT